MRALVILLFPFVALGQAAQLSEPLVETPPAAFAPPSATPAGAGIPDRMGVLPAEDGVRHGTDRRVLPPEAHPGLWSADPVEAKQPPRGPGGEPGRRRYPDDERNLLLGLYLPVLTDELPLWDAVALAHQCKASMEARWRDVGTRQEYLDLLDVLYQHHTRPEHGTPEYEAWAQADLARFQCLAALMYELCGQLARHQAIHDLPGERAADLSKLPVSIQEAAALRLLALAEEKCPESAVGRPGWKAIPKVLELIKRGL